MGPSFNRKVSGVSTLLLTISLVWGLPSIPTTISSPASSCLPIECNWPSVSTERTHCYEIDANSCNFNEEIRQSSPGNDGFYYVYIPGVLPPTSKTYKNDYACIWKFPSPGSCKRYHIKIDWMNLKGADSCTCADHVLLDHSGDQTKCITYGDNSSIPDSNTDITIKFRSDGLDVADGFLIMIYKHTYSHCVENMDEDEDTFDIRTIPSIAGCPAFTLERVEEQLKLAKKMFDENAHSDMKLVLPLKQCYCFGTCTAKDEKERDTLMASFIKPNMYTSNNFVNSPDSVLRNMARVAQSIIEKNGIEEKL